MVQGIAQRFVLATHIAAGILQQLARKEQSTLSSDRWFAIMSAEHCF